MRFLEQDFFTILFLFVMGFFLINVKLYYKRYENMLKINNKYIKTYFNTDNPIYSIIFKFIFSQAEIIFYYKIYNICFLDSYESNINYYLIINLLYYGVLIFKFFLFSTLSFFLSNNIFAKQLVFTINSYESILSLTLFLFSMIFLNLDFKSINFSWFYIMCFLFFLLKVYIYLYTYKKLDIKKISHIFSYFIYICTDFLMISAVYLLFKYKLDINYFL